MLNSPAVFGGNLFSLPGCERSSRSLVRRRRSSNVTARIHVQCQRESGSVSITGRCAWIQRSRLNPYQLRTCPSGEETGSCVSAQALPPSLASPRLSGVFSFNCRKVLLSKKEHQRETELRDPHRLCLLSLKHVLTCFCLLASIR